METNSPTTDSTLQQLEERLLEKEELVAALTDQLEQAAERLDRVHRTGGDRGLGGGTIPPELIKQQQELTDELTRAVQQWDDMQVAASLGRLEIQLSELRDLVAGQGAPTNPRQPFRQPDDDDSSRLDMATRRDDSRETAETTPTDVYESLKAALLDSSEPAYVDLTSDAVDAAEFLTPLEPVEPPQPMDFDEAGVEELRQAVDDRDAYIQYLAARLRQPRPRLPAPGEWEKLAGVPEELVSHLEELERRLDETLRLTEVEHSFERARLGREASRLRQLEDHLKKESARIGWSAGHDTEEPSDDADTGKRRRWLRFLSRPTNDDVGDD